MEHLLLEESYWKRADTFQLFVFTSPGAHVPLVHPQCVVLVVEGLQLDIGITSSSEKVVWFRDFRAEPIEITEGMAPAPVILHDGDTPVSSYDSALVQEIGNVILWVKMLSWVESYHSGVLVGNNLAFDLQLYRQNGKV